MDIHFFGKKSRSKFHFSRWISRRLISNVTVLWYITWITIASKFKFSATERLTDVNDIQFLMFFQSFLFESIHSIVFSCSTKNITDKHRNIICIIIASKVQYFQWWKGSSMSLPPYSWHFHSVLLNKYQKSSYSCNTRRCFECYYW